MKFKRHVISLVLGLCGMLACGVALAGFDEGLAAYNKAAFAQAVQEWRPVAAQGNVDAQNYLGGMYESGLGVKQDSQEAAKWYRLAAAQGHVYAQYNLGLMYLLGGHGMAKDIKEAVKWYRLAAAQGHAIAQFNLGMLYKDGQGVAQDYLEVVKWLRLAAAQGHAAAQFNLGAAYQYGVGVTSSRVAAYALYNISAANDPASTNLATKNRMKVMEAMSPKEIEAGQALTRELSKPGNFLNALDANAKKFMAGK